MSRWAEANSVTPQFRQLATTACQPIFGAESRELSLLYVLFYIASSGNETNQGTFERNFNTRQGAQQWRFQGGSQLIPLKIASDLGKQVVLSSPVRRIIQSGGGVQVVADKVTVNAKKVIVAVPPTLAGRIDYTPDLPTQRDALMQRVPQGALIKAGAVYGRPWWRDKGLNGSSAPPTDWSAPPSTTRPRTRAWACSSGSSAATRRASSTPWRPTTARARC